MQPDRQRGPFCRQCGAQGDSVLRGEDFKRAAEHFGIVVEGGGGNEPRQEFPWRDLVTGERVIQTRPGPRGAKYGFPKGTRKANLVAVLDREWTGVGPVVICEGHKAAQGAARLGFDALGLPDEGMFKKQRPAKQLHSLLAGRVVWAWPDNDTGGFDLARRLVGFFGKHDEPCIVDPEKLIADVPAKWDADDYLPESAEAGHAAVEAALMTSLELERSGRGTDKAKSATSDLATPAPHSDAGSAELLEKVLDLGDVVPVEHIGYAITEEEMAESAAIRGGRCLRFDADARTWWRWRSGKGWTELSQIVLLAAAMRCGRFNYGKWFKPADGPPVKVSDEKSGGKRSTANGMLAALQGFTESKGADWDATGYVVGLPDGRALNIKKGEVFDVTRDHLIRRRLAAEPCTREEYERSKWREVVEHVVPDDQEREWLQRRLGAALIDAPGGDDLIALYGDAGSGKGVLLTGVTSSFGSYSVNIPQQELTVGGSRGHAQWKYRMLGRRLLTLDEIPARSLDGEAVKSLLGTMITGNPMRGGSVDFSLRAPVLTTSNDAPSVRVADPGLERRLKPIECGPSIPEGERDPRVREWVQSPEGQSCVVYWLVAGAQAFLESGGGPLPPPQSVSERSSMVMSDSTMAQFLQREASLGPQGLSALWSKFKAYKIDAGEPGIGSRTAFCSTLRRSHWRLERTKNANFWHPPAERPIENTNKTGLGGASGGTRP